MTQDLKPKLPTTPFNHPAELTEEEWQAHRAANDYADDHMCDPWEDEDWDNLNEDQIKRVNVREIEPWESNAWRR
jgi:hypothetical protein